MDQLRAPCLRMSAFSSASSCASAHKKRFSTRATKRSGVVVCIAGAGQHKGWLRGAFRGHGPCCATTGATRAPLALHPVQGVWNGDSWPRATHLSRPGPCAGNRVEREQWHNGRVSAAPMQLGTPTVVTCVPGLQLKQARASRTRRGGQPSVCPSQRGLLHGSNSPRNGPAGQRMA